MFVSCGSSVIVVVIVLVVNITAASVSVVARLAVGLVETRPDTRVTDPIGSLGNPT